MRIHILTIRKWSISSSCELSYFLSIVGFNIFILPLNLLEFAEDQRAVQQRKCTYIFEFFSNERETRPYFDVFSFFKILWRSAKCIHGRETGFKDGRAVFSSYHAFTLWSPPLPESHLSLSFSNNHLAPEPFIYGLWIHVILNDTLTAYFTYWLAFIVYESFILHRHYYF